MIAAICSVGSDACSNGRSSAVDFRLLVHRLPFGFWCLRCFCRGLRWWWRGFRVCWLPFHLQGHCSAAVLAAAAAVLVLYLIYVDQGFSLWFVHPSGGGACWCGVGGGHRCAAAAGRFLRRELTSFECLFQR